MFLQLSLLKVTVPMLLNGKSADANECLQKNIHSIMVIFPSTPVCNSHLKNCVTKPVMTHSWGKGWWDENLFSLNNHRSMNVTLFVTINLQMIQLIVTSVLAAKDISPIDPIKIFHLTHYITVFPEVVSARRLFSRRSWSFESCDICKSIIKCILERCRPWICLLLFRMWQ